MDASVIVLDSDSEEDETVRSVTERKRKGAPLGSNVNGKEGNGGGIRNNVAGCRPLDKPAIKRIKPITIATNLSMLKRQQQQHEPSNNNNESVTPNENFAVVGGGHSVDDWEQQLHQYRKSITVHPEDERRESSSSAATEDAESADRKTGTPRSSTTNESESTNRSERKNRPSEKNLEKNAITAEFEELLSACRKADSSKDMESLIQKKLIRYYECVHPDFVHSKSFKKTVTTVTADVLAHPTLVYLKLANIVEELNIRRKSRTSVMTNENITGGTGNEKKDNQIRRLNRALYILKKRIAKLEETEVNFDEDINSAYMMEERYKKRASEIYEKICDITGESKHAHRIVRKPINFQGTMYAEFNRTIQTFVNRTNTFPDFFDVLKCLQHCNTQYSYRLRRDEMTKIAQDAFMKIGKQLQKRRKTDLYETVSYYSGVEQDPAVSDLKLREKLEDNKKHYSKVGDLIDKFARVQDNDTDVESPEGEPKKSGSAASHHKSPSVVGEPVAASLEPSTSKSLLPDSGRTGNDAKRRDPDSNRGDKGSEDKRDAEDAYDSDDDEDDEEDEMIIKENVKPDTFDDIEISDDEELIVPIS